MGSKKEIMDANQDCYTHFSNCSLPADLIKSLEEISQDFDAFGLPSLNFDDPTDVAYFLKQLINNTSSLIQLYRVTLHNKHNKSKDTENRDLYLHLSNKVKKLEHSVKQKELIVENQNKKIRYLEEECENLKTKEHQQKNDFNKIRYMYGDLQNKYKFKCTQLQVEIEKLKGEKEIEPRLSKDEVFLNYMKIQLQKEDLYKSTITKLQRCNDELLAEINSLKQHIAALQEQQEV